MAVTITVTVTHLDPAVPTIARVLAARLGREPSHAELVADVRRILGARPDETRRERPP